MSNLLLEILSEEIPAKMLTKATAAFADTLKQELAEIAFAEVQHMQTYNSPRRITICCSLLEKSCEVQEVRGPKVSADTKAIGGFLKKHNLQNISQLEARGEFYFHKPVINSQDNKLTIAQSIKSALEKFTWKKSMRWGTETIRWVRPIRSILCILNGEALPVQFGSIKSGITTKGHRFMHNKVITITNIADYHAFLKDAYVEVNQETRRASILEQIENLIRDLGLKLRVDEALLEEVTNLVEWPVVMLSQIPEHLMSLPHEVLIITLRENQKYLLLEDASRKLAPYFIIVANVIAKDGGTKIIEGNQRVLQARLYDAVFFYKQDQETKLTSRLEQLKTVAYHAKIGSIYDRVQTTKQLCAQLAPLFGVANDLAMQVAELAKADLTTSMVKEFPELQGVMGYYYALNDGLPEQVARAIGDHYKPRGPSDSTPVSSLGRLIALADKLDIIKQLFAVDIKPTGSKDPFALRRCAIGAIRLIKDQGLVLEDVLIKLELKQDVTDFILERQKFM